MKEVEDPHTHKKLGRGVKGYDDKIWKRSM